MRGRIALATAQGLQNKVIAKRLSVPCSDRHQVTQALQCRGSRWAGGATTLPSTTHDTRHDRHSQTIGRRLTRWNRRRSNPDSTRREEDAA